MKAAQKPIHAVTTWVRRQPPKVKAFIGVVSAMAALVLLRMIVHDHDNLFIAAEAGISVLIYKLTKERTCAGTQILILEGFLGLGVAELIGFELVWWPLLSFRLDRSSALLRTVMVIVCGGQWGQVLTILLYFPVVTFKWQDVVNVTFTWFSHRVEKVCL